MLAPPGPHFHTPPSPSSPHKSRCTCLFWGTHLSPRASAELGRSQCPQPACGDGPSRESLEVTGQLNKTPPTSHPSPLLPSHWFSLSTVSRPQPAPNPPRRWRQVEGSAHAPRGGTRSVGSWKPRGAGAKGSRRPRPLCKAVASGPRARNAGGKGRD